MKKSVVLALFVALVASFGAFAQTCTKVVCAGSSIKAVVDTAKPGDVICLSGGVYRQNNVWVGVSGTADKPITITAAPGEKPVLDGEGMLTPDWATFFTLDGQYLILSDIAIKNGVSPGIKGIWMRGQNNTVKGVTVDNVLGQGIFITADYSTVEGSTVSRASMSNKDCAQCNPSSWGFGIGSYLDYTTAKVVKGMVLRGNTSHDNWGEGMQTFQSTGAVVEDNVAYDNFSVNFYIVASTGAMFRRNMGYNTPNNSVGGRYPGLNMSDEQQFVTSSGNVVINNFFYNADVQLYKWTQVAGTGLKDVLLAGNTVINGEIDFGTAANTSHAGSSIKNNIIYRNDGKATGTIPPLAGITFSNNVWFPTRPANANGFNDRVGIDPLLAKTGPTGSGQLTAGYFKLASLASSAVGAGAVLPEVTKDFFGTPRGNPPASGGHELSCMAP